MAYFTLLLVLLGTIGGAISYEANAALPGEPLYVYKISVNEEIEKFVANTDESRARWDLYTLTERLKEAQVLAQHDQLTASAQTAVTSAVNTHIGNLTEIIKRYQSAGHAPEAAATAVTLYETLKTQERAIADASLFGSTNVQLQLAPVLVKLRTSLATVAHLSTAAQANAAIGTPVADVVITNPN